MPAQPVLFVGSSILEQWGDPSADFPGLPVFNRAIGGTTTRDQLKRFDEIVLPHHPAVVVYYCGSNDLKRGVSPEEAFANFKAFTGRLKKERPAASLLFLSSIRSPDRIKIWDKVDRYNQLARDHCATSASLSYHDVHPFLMQADGTPVPGFYQEDALHLLPAAYRAIGASLAPRFRAVHRAAIAGRPPNFILIQCDDLGWDDLGLHGNPHVHTPNIDALGRESVRFSHFTVNPVCAPSRATLLTGRHFLRTGVSHVHGGKDFLHQAERTLADQLRSAGYKTGMWGKWHLGITEGYLPWQSGFDEAYMADLYRHRETRGSMNGREVAHDGWADQVIADQVIDFMRRHRGGPFFAYVPTLTPHVPYDAPEKWVKFYTDRGHPEAIAKIWAMISFLDEQVGRIRSAVSDLGLANDTVIVFLSDNGPAIDRGALSDEDRKLRKPGVLRGWKGDLYEGAVRSPLFIHWPGTLQARVIDTHVDSSDLSPTLMELAGAAPLDGTPAMDGRSFRDLLFGGGFAEHPVFDYAHRGWLNSGPPYSLDGIPGEYLPLSPEAKAALDFDQQSLSVREGKYKWMRNPEFGSSRPMLIDLTSDPSETTDLSEKHPEIRDRLDASLRHWWQEIVREPASFGHPVFHLRPGGNSIPARAPAAMTGEVFNNVVELKNWRKPGESARFGCRLDQSAKAVVSLRWHPQPPDSTRWRIAVAGTAAAVEFDGVEAVGLDLPEGGFELELKLLDTGGREITSTLRGIQIRF